VRLCLLACFVFSRAAFAQNVSPEVPVCTAANVDVAVQVADTADHYHSIALNLVNISDTSCNLESAPLPTFNASGQVRPVRTCLNCSPDGVSHPSSPLILKPGSAAHQEYRWRTEGEHCDTAKWLNSSVDRDFAHGLLVVAEKLIPQICSDVSVSGYRAGAFPASWAASDTGREADAAIRLTADKDSYLGSPDLPSASLSGNEEISLHLTSEPLSNFPPSDASSCPVLLQKTRTANGFTRFDEESGKRYCWAASVTNSNERSRSIDVDAGHRGQWTGLGDTAISFTQLAKSQQGTWSLAAESNTLVLHIVDAQTAPRTWGKQENGVAIALGLDAETYRIDQDIPLHIALENVSAEAPIYGKSTVLRPGEVVQVDVFDASGKRLDHSTRPPNSLWISGGPGRLARYPKGTVVPLELSVGSVSFLPDHPGRFTVVATWAPYKGYDDTCESCELPSDFDPAKHYAQVHSAPVTFVVRESDH
jgi:hypothetical protein